MLKKTKSSLYNWIFENNPLFKEITYAIDNIILNKTIQDFDNLIMYSRYPLRTLLLVIDYLESKDISKYNDFFRSLNVDAEKIEDEIYDELYKKYFKALKKREPPALIWSQRRLVPKSAYMRAKYISEMNIIKNPNIFFLGDDDIVSPLINKLIPQSNIYTIDIDSEVLQKVSKVSETIGSNINIIHDDISRLSKEYYNNFDIVICDPFPSIDGTFERYFWIFSYLLLKNNGRLITTTSPSHKKIDYCRKSQRELHNLGFTVIDMQADFGAYEVFDFELCNYEIEIINRNNFNCNISQTKSLLTAVKSKAFCEYGKSNFEFNNWMYKISQHYLTIQAGRRNQLDIVKKRCPKNILKFYNFSELLDTGFDLNLLIPQHTNYNNKSFEDIISIIENEGILINEGEFIEMKRLGSTKQIEYYSEISWLWLTLRALESWNRNA